MSKTPSFGTVDLKGTLPNTYMVNIITDGRNTLAEVVALNAYGQYVSVGTGRSRRRKNEKRNDDLGHVLALKRAFEAAAKALGETAEELDPGARIDD